MKDISAWEKLTLLLLLLLWKRMHGWDSSAYFLTHRWRAGWKALFLPNAIRAYIRFAIPRARYTII